MTAPGVGAGPEPLNISQHEVNTQRQGRQAMVISCMGQSGQQAVYCVFRLLFRRIREQTSSEILGRLRNELLVVGRCQSQCIGRSGVVQRIIEHGLR